MASEKSLYLGMAGKHSTNLLKCCFEMDSSEESLGVIFEKRNKEF